MCHPLYYYSPWPHREAASLRPRQTRLQLVRLPGHPDVGPSLVEELSGDAQRPDVVPGADHRHEVHPLVVQSHAGVGLLLVVVVVAARAEDVLPVVLLVDVEHVGLVVHLFPDGERDAVVALLRGHDALVVLDLKVCLDQALKERGTSSVDWLKSRRKEDRISAHLSAGNLEGILEAEGAVAVARGNHVAILDHGIGVFQLEVWPVVV